MVCSDITEGPQDNQFAYEYATETIIEGNSDKVLSCKRYHFNKVMDKQVNTHAPFISMAHQRKLQLEIDDYEVEDGIYRPIRLTKKIYKDTLINQVKRGFMVYSTHSGDIFASGENCKQYIDYMGGGAGSTIYLPISYKYQPSWSYLDSQFVTDFYKDGSSSVSAIYYSYGNTNHCQAKEIKQVKGNEMLITRSIYAGDCENDDICKLMVTANMCGELMSRKLYKKDTNKEVFLGGIKNVYNSKFLKEEVYKYFESDAKEDSVRVYRYKYNDKMRLSEYIGSDGIPTSIWWDKHDLRPLIVSPGMVEQELKSAVSDKPMTNDNLRLLYKHGSFKKAFVHTYTYNQDGSIQSETLPNGVTTYYEYDGFGRLNAVKDMNGKIISSYQYHYMDQK